MKTEIKCVIFDLDGTLLDTSPGIMESVRYAAEKLGYPSLSEKLLQSFIGPPLKDSFMRCYQCSEAEAKALTESYRSYYREGALFHAVPYERIFELCDQLKGMGTDLAVATSKPQVFAEQILNHFGFEFSCVHGADMAGKLKKSDLIRLCMEDVGADKPQCVMVGDTEYDAKGAQEADIAFLGVSYGFGNMELMLQYPSIGLAEKPMDILNIIL